MLFAFFAGFAAFITIAAPIIPISASDTQIIIVSMFVPPLSLFTTLHVH